MLKRASPPERITGNASSCVEEKSPDFRLVDFITQDGSCYSFPVVQLVQCVLEKNPALQDQAGSAPDRLTIVFPTQDMVVLGWNLKTLRDALDLGKLMTVRACDARYAGVEDKQPFVTNISVKAQS